MLATPLGPVAFARDLARFGDRPALITATGTVTYGELVDRADTAATAMGSGRRLVALAVTPAVDSVAAYLGALRAGHVVLLSPPGDAAAAVLERYEPDVVAGPDPDAAVRITVRHRDPRHQLHPDLALLMSTSGSTGSPKLVRLSRTNLDSNAAAIAEYLGIVATDRAATTLPLHYCYGLSVLHSHLGAGAAVVLTDRSVSEPEFWDLFRRTGATTFAGVPYTFDLLDRIGFADLDLPGLRYITQAGGRLAPERVRRYAELGRRRGFDLVVMYGQTEATARIAYLPPHLAITRPAAIGRALPGGSLRVERDSDDTDVGELVFRGPGVMLGYAEGPADLARGRDIDELRTGDLARQGEDGLWEIVGRRSRFLKLYGLRIDLDRVEQAVGRLRLTAVATGSDDHLVVAVTRPDRPAGPDAGVGTDADVDRDPRAAVRAAVTAASGLPPHVVTVHVLAEIPRRPNGKPDYDALRSLAPDVRAEPPDTARAVSELYARVLGGPVGDDDTFAGLGGDSLSFVEVSIRLERVIGTPPPDWPQWTVRELATRARPTPRRVAPVDTAVFLRAVSVVLVVAQHAQVLAVHGGAHVMLGVAGYNLARLQLDDAPAGTRLRRVLLSLARVVVPTVGWAAFVVVVLGGYSSVSLYLGYYLTGAVDAHHEAELWFIEVLVFYVLGATLLVSTPWGYRWERRYRFAVPMAVVGAGLMARFDLIPGLTATPYVTHGVTPLVIVWVFGLGWAAARAGTTAQRLLVSGAVLIAVPGFFAYAGQDVVVATGLLALVWLRALPSWPALNRVLGALAGASLYIYVTHYQIVERLAGVGAPHLLGVAASLLFGLTVAAGVSAIRRLRTRIRGRAGEVTLRVS